MFGDRAVLFTAKKSHMYSRKTVLKKSKQTILGSEQEIIDYMTLPGKMKKGS